MNHHKWIDCEWGLTLLTWPASIWTPFALALTVSALHCRTVRNSRWGDLHLLNRGWSSQYHPNPPQFLCAQSEVVSSVSPTLDQDSRGWPPHQVWNKNRGRWGWVHFVVVTMNEAKTSLPQPTYQYALLPNCSRCHPISSFQGHLHGMWCISSSPTHLGRSQPTPSSSWHGSRWICCRGRHNQLVKGSKVSERVSSNDKRSKQTNSVNNNQAEPM